MTRNLKRLLKVHNFKTIDDYYQYIIESQINGDFTQVKSLFIDLPRANRKDFLIRTLSSLEIDNTNQSAHYSVLISCIAIMN